MERLRVAEHGGHGLYASTAHVVVRILLGERPAGSLRVGAQGHRFGVLCTETLHNLCPKHTCSAHLGNLHEVVDAYCPEERQARGKGIDVDARVYTGANVLHAVGQGVGKLYVGRRTGLLHMVTGDGD